MVSYGLYSTFPYEGSVTEPFLGLGIWNVLRIIGRMGMAFWMIMKTKTSALLVSLAIFLVALTFLQSYVIMLSFRIQPATNGKVDCTTGIFPTGGDPSPVTLRKTQEAGNTTAWCLLDNKNTRLVSGIPHAMQSLGVCWSYFCRMRERYGDSVGCGIYLENYGVWERASNVGTDRKGWVADLLDSMNCTISAKMPDARQTFVHRPPLNATNWKQLFVWFERPSDASSLAKAVIGSSAVAARTITTARPLSIGVIQRVESRLLTNINEITQAVSEKFPGLPLEVAEMEGMTFLDQAKFWNSKDVVIAAHGAAMANAVFMRRGASIVEIYPAHYYPRIYEALCRRIGIQHFAWYDEVIDVDEDHTSHGKTMRERHRLRTANLSPPVEKIVDLTLQAVRSAMLVWEIDSQYL